MRVHLVLLLVAVWLATGDAGPQRKQQQDNPLSMGMKFLGNLRNSMSSAVSGLFRPRNNRPTKVRHQQRPTPAQQRQPQAQVAPHHVNQAPNHVTRGPQNSFFTVVHEDEVVTQASTAPHSLPLADDHGDDSFQPSSFFSGNDFFQGNIQQETFSAPKRPNDFGFGHLKDDSKIPKTFSQGVNTRTSHQNFQSSGFQKGPGLQVVSPPNFKSSDSPSGFTHFSREEPIGFRQSSSSFSSSPVPSSLTSSSSSLSSSLSQSSSPSSPFKHSSSSFAKKPQKHLPHQENNIPDFFTVADPQGHETTRTKGKFQSEITPAQLKFTNHFTQTRPSITTRRDTPSHYSTPSHISTPIYRPVVRPTRASRLPSAAVPSGSKKPLLPIKPTTGDRHINTGFKLQVAPKDGDKVAHISGYEWGYGVLDQGTGNQFFHAEKREDGTTKGSYKIQLPDGRIQTVTYTADDKGYHPVVTYEGEATFPDYSDAAKGVDTKSTA